MATSYCKPHLSVYRLGRFFSPFPLLPPLHFSNIASKNRLFGYSKRRRQMSQLYSWLDMLTLCHVLFKKIANGHSTIFTAPRTRICFFKMIGRRWRMEEDNFKAAQCCTHSWFLHLYCKNAEICSAFLSRPWVRGINENPPFLDQQLLDPLFRGTQR